MCQLQICRCQKPGCVLCTWNKGWESCQFRFDRQAYPRGLPWIWNCCPLQDAEAVQSRSLFLQRDHLAVCNTNTHHNISKHINNQQHSITSQPYFPLLLNCISNLQMEVAFATVTGLWPSVTSLFPERSLLDNNKLFCFLGRLWIWNLDSGDARGWAAERVRARSAIQGLLMPTEGG